MSQNLQNMQNQQLLWDAEQPRRRRKAAGWQAFPNPKKGYARF